jgi:hypothetical protein
VREDPPAGKNHSQKVATALKLKSHVKAGAGSKDEPPSGRNHSQKVAAALKLKS